MSATVLKYIYMTKKALGLTVKISETDLTKFNNKAKELHEAGYYAVDYFHSVKLSENVYSYEQTWQKK